jgi:hypothetical protein
MAACILLIALTAIGAEGQAQAQPATTGRVPAALANAVRAVDPPARPGAWVLQVISRGGLDGRGTGDLTIDSDTTHPAVRREQLTTIDGEIRRLTAAAWAIDQAPSVCSDCVITLMQVAIREGDGSVRRHTVYWDPTSRTRIPPDVLRIYDLATTAAAR